MTLNDLECPIQLKVRMPHRLSADSVDTSLAILLYSCKTECGAQWSARSVSEPRKTCVADALSLCGSWASCLSLLTDGFRTMSFSTDASVYINFGAEYKFWMKYWNHWQKNQNRPTDTMGKDIGNFILLQLATILDPANFTFYGVSDILAYRMDVDYVWVPLYSACPCKMSLNCGHRLRSTLHTLTIVY